MRLETQDFLISGFALKWYDNHNSLGTLQSQEARVSRILCLMHPARLKKNQARGKQRENESIIEILNQLTNRNVDEIS